MDQSLNLPCLGCFLVRAHLQLPHILARPMILQSLGFLVGLREMMYFQQLLPQLHSQILHSGSHTHLERML